MQSCSNRSNCGSVHSKLGGSFGARTLTYLADLTLGLPFQAAPHLTPAAATAAAAAAPAPAYIQPLGLQFQAAPYLTPAASPTPKP